MTINETFGLAVAVCLESVQLQRQVSKAAQSLGYAVFHVQGDAEVLCPLPQRSILITDESWFHDASPDPMAFATELRPRCVMLHIVQQGNVEGALKSIRAGACAVLERPVDDSVLINNIRAAVDLEAKFSRRQRMSARSRWKIDSLNLSEAAVFKGLIEGRSNKDIAREIGIGLRSVEFTRAQIMLKLNLTTLAQLLAIVTSEQVRAAIEPLREFDAILSRHLREGDRGSVYP